MGGKAILGRLSYYNLSPRWGFGCKVNFRFYKSEKTIFDLMIEDPLRGFGLRTFLKSRWQSHLFGHMVSKSLDFQGIYRKIASLEDGFGLFKPILWQVWSRVNFPLN